MKCFPITEMLFALQHSDECSEEEEDTFLDLFSDLDIPISGKG